MSTIGNTNNSKYECYNILKSKYITNLSKFIEVT